MDHVPTESSAMPKNSFNGGALGIRASFGFRISDFEFPAGQPRATFSNQGTLAGGPHFDL
jgi:hypothetical protein